jgi:electron transport complex protein RnfB
MEILIPIIVLGGIGLVLGMFLAFASKKFEVEVNPYVERIMEILPGANCGACGYPGCAGYAEAIAESGAEITACAPGGSDVVNAIAKIMGMEGGAVAGDKIVARVRCAGDNTKTRKLYDYDAELKTCSTSVLYFSGDKSCFYGCLGYGDCARVCPVDAITITDKGIAIIDEDKCISCGKCEKACPKHVIKMTPQSQPVTVMCSSKDKGATAKKACEVACIGCGLCERVCPVEGKAVHVNNNLALIDPETCIKCGLCAIKCPTNAIQSQIKEVKKAKIIEEKCIGCTACARVCPVNAIEGEVKQKHKVDPEKCIGCGLCYDKCKFSAIEIEVIERKD